MSNARGDRLIERWLPIAELGEESSRERRSMTALPPVYYLHVWWARRPLVVARAAVLASLLPGDADRGKFMHALGVHGDPLASRRRIDDAKRTGIRFEGAAYSYKRAFMHRLSQDELTWLSESFDSNCRPTLLDPTAGGGAIPFEALRVGCNAVANDLNPVAALILKLTVEAPRVCGAGALSEFRRVSERFIALREQRLSDLFPIEPEPGAIPTNYLWARTIVCPYCDGVVPLSPNWRLAPDGTGVRLLPQVGSGPNTPGRVCRFEIVHAGGDHGASTVSGGDATCPFPDCGRVIPGADVKRQAQARGMGDQLFTIVFKRRVEKRTKAGKVRVSWERGYRAPTERDENLPEIKRLLAERLSVWEARGIIPTEVIPQGNKTSEPLRYGMTRWSDLFNQRQLYGHCTGVEIYQELVAEERGEDELSPETTAAFGYLAFALDKMLNYNSRMSIWMSTREITANTFNRHDFAFCWSFAEMVPLIAGVGVDWVIEQTGKCIKELIGLLKGSAAPLLEQTSRNATGSVVITCNNGARLDRVPDASIHAVVIDPPYGANVMYAELSDFFYVWLKRTAGLVYPEFFRAKLTDKEHEAVANPARFDGQRGAAAIAELDYRDKMAAIFAECRRVLIPGGIMTLMFTHKATGAWDALAQGLIEAGFVITASWPINTESESSMHIRDKAAANSTIFLVCRPRAISEPGEAVYWDDLEPRVREAVRARIEEFRSAGIRGVDLYLACFGPALQVLSEHWPVQRIAPRASSPTEARRRGTAIDATIDPYAVTPEDALDAARTEVKRWRLERLSSLAAREGLDAVTSWFVLAWDAFAAAVFPHDEALRLARVCGVDLDKDIVGHYAEKKGDKLTLWDSATRAAKHALGPPDGSRSMLDAVHHAAYLARARSLDASRLLLEEHALAKRAAFIATFDAVRQVLPVSADYSGLELPKAAAGAGDDFRALEDLRRLLYAAELAPPQQLALLTVPTDASSLHR